MDLTPTELLAEVTNAEAIATTARTALATANTAVIAAETDVATAETSTGLSRNVAERLYVERLYHSAPADDIAAALSVRSAYRVLDAARVRRARLAGELNAAELYVWSAHRASWPRA